MPLKHLVSKRARKNADGSGSSNQPPVNMRTTRDNRYLFRNAGAYNNFLGQFQSRELTNCYYFDKSNAAFNNPEDAKIDQYRNHWNWDSLLTCSEPYTEIFTRIFYSNFEITMNPFRATSYVCGTEIELSLDNIANWLGLTNDGEETYPLRNWPQLAVGTTDQYKTWFDRTNIAGGPLYASSLPSLHRLLYLFINNILTPKTKIKTNMEWNSIYYLRHLISLDDKTFNIPYIILRHMKNAFDSRVYHLPYGHLIHKIIRLNGLVIPQDLSMLQPVNLITELPNINWIQALSYEGLPHFKPDGRPINRWIFAQNALPNQYWDPDEEVNIPPVQQPPIQVQPPQSMQEQMTWMVNQMESLHTKVDGYNTRIIRVEKGVRRSLALIREIDNTQQDLLQRWVGRYGAAKTPGSTSRRVDTDDDGGDGDDGDDGPDIDDRMDDV